MDMKVEFKSKLQNEKKILYFEGAGCVPRGEVSNCRICTAFTNDYGKKIYLEITGLEGSVNCSARGFIQFCYYITDDPRIDDCNRSTLLLSPSEGLNYTYDSILSFVNTRCKCSFEKVEVLEWLSGYKVSTGIRTETYAAYNYGDEFVYDPELHKRREAKKKELSAYFKNLFNQKYDNTSYWVDDGKSNILHIRLNVSEEKRIKAGYTEREFDVEV